MRFQLGKSLGYDSTQQTLQKSHGARRPTATKRFQDPLVYSRKATIGSVLAARRAGR
jgi:hypothetical protein